MKKTATDFFTGRRGNCAQAVASAWAAETGVDHIVSELSSCGSGRAPEGLCGALYAACRCAPDHAGRIKDSFSEKTGGNIACRDIRAARVVSCAGCVGLAAGILEELNSRD